MVAKQTGCIMRIITGQSAFGASAQPPAMIPGAIQPGALPGAFAGATNNATQNAFQTIVGAERYPFQGFANQFLRDQHDGCDTIIDVASLSIAWGTSPRPSLIWMPWEDLQAYARSYAVLLENYPTYWATHNDGTNGEVWIYPAPSTQSEMEWNVYCLPKNLYSDADYDAVPGNFSDAVKFYAAAMCYDSSYRHLQAAAMRQQFLENLMIARSSVDAGKVPQTYWSNFG